MKAVVVYESLWGNTAAVAAAIAEGIGAGARALSTATATADEVKNADLVVAGCPIHAMSMPTRESRESTKNKPLGPGELASDLSHPPMREWLASLGPSDAAAAAFDTRIKGPLGHGGSSRVLKGLRKAGCTPIGKPEGFAVSARATTSERGGLLRPGELERAREWGRELAKLVAS